jgi:alpha,alpha-trehalose-phosphate synthase [UDP-forming]
MRMGMRVILTLSVAIIVIACLFASFEVRAERRHKREDLERYSQVLAESLADSVEAPLAKGSSRDLQRTLERFGAKLVGLAVYDPSGAVLAVTPALAGRLTTRPPPVDAAALQNQGQGGFIKLGGMTVYAYALPLHNGQSVVGTLAIFDDATSIETQGAKLWRDTLIRLLVEMLLIPLFVFLVVRWSLRAPIARTAQWMTELRKGRTIPRPGLPDEDLFKPLTQEMTHFVQSLEVARAAAAEEARLRNAGEALWTPERLRAHVGAKLHGEPLFVVSNREPYVHSHQGKSIEVVVPASGLVTALEPILRACDGTWIAHGSGDADRETVDQRDRLRAPPEEPQYTLRRVWLTKEEEDGYYLGFANEGLWPLCHIAHTRPIFRSEDWGHYQEVNRKFARAVLEEIEGVAQPAVLIQDYHFALLPRLVKEQRPDARLAIFWHIPWPNPEAFGICPWQRDLLEGLLGADLVGFHTQAHCTNFLETVDRALESRIEWDRFAVDRSGHSTAVRPFPISVAFPEPLKILARRNSPTVKRDELLKAFGVHATHMGIGVDRVDYTKGILERFRGVERFLEKYPAYQKRFTFVQIGAPSRTDIKRYSDLLAEVGAEAERINLRFQSNGWKPIVFLKKHHSHQEIEPFYRAANVCLVTSLHDGMNLVAKEFVATRDDEQGVLILSHFTGASRELRDAMVVNPYDSEELADAVHTALEMSPEERNTRMRHMRRVVRENNIYRWGGNLITELAEIRPEQPELVPDAHIHSVHSPEILDRISRAAGRSA